MSVLEAREAAVSRDSRRDALADAADQKLVQQAEEQVKQRNAALAQFAKQAEAQAAKIALNQWVLPLDGYRLTAEFGDYGLWANYHTGLDFAAPSGTPIHAIANGVVTSVGYDGAYGNKTVLTLDDGTELWYCHQTSTSPSTRATWSAPARSSGTSAPPATSPAPTSTSRCAPEAGDPVDPYEALRVHGLTRSERQRAERVRPWTRPRVLVGAHPSVVVGASASERSNKRRVAHARSR